METQTASVKHKKVQPLIESLGFLVNGAGKMMRGALEARLKEFEITTTTWTALIELGQKERLTQTDLARRIFLDGATITRTLDLLESRGYIRRLRDDNDRRTHIIEITKDGYDVALKCSEYGAEVNDEFTQYLNGNDREELEEMLRKIIEYKLEEQNNDNH